MTKDQLIGAYAGWLEERTWNWFCTLTFRGFPSAKRADRLFRSWISEVRQEVGATTFRWVRVTERGANQDNLHFHVLVGGLRDATKWDWVLRWDEIAGDCLIAYYVPRRGAVRYMLKEAEPGCNFDIEIQMPPIERSL